MANYNKNNLVNGAQSVRTCKPINLNRKKVELPDGQYKSDNPNWRGTTLIVKKGKFSLHFYRHNEKQEQSVINPPNDFNPIIL